MRLDVGFIIFSTRNGHEKKKVGIKIKHVLKRKVFDALQTHRLCVLVANEDDFGAGRRPDGILTRKMRAMAGSPRCKRGRFRVKIIFYFKSTNPYSDL